MGTDVPPAQDDPPTPWETISPEVEVVPAPPRVFRFADRASAGLPGGGALTIPLMCLGIALIAACLLIPAADDVRRLAYERERLRADLEQLQKQVQTNEAFLQRVASDATLAERLARRQMKMVPEGSAVLELQSAKPQHDISPFLLVTVPPPAPLAPYQPIGGLLASVCRTPKMQLYLIGASLMMIASGLVLSRSSRDDGMADNEEQPCGSSRS